MSCLATRLEMAPRERVANSSFVSLGAHELAVDAGDEVRRSTVASRGHGSAVRGFLRVGQRIPRDTRSGEFIVAIAFVEAFGLGGVTLARVVFAVAFLLVAVLFSCSHLGGGRDLELFGSGRDCGELLVERGSPNSMAGMVIVRLPSSFVLKAGWLITRR